MKTYYIVSGGFDPIHEGHIELIKAATMRSDGVIVLLNSDAWLCRKKGKNFMKFETRRTICENLKGVADVLEFDDSDNSACDGIRRARKKYPVTQLVFANGGDRTVKNIPEIEACEACNVSLEFGVGGENKANSSSWILKNWEQTPIDTGEIFPQNHSNENFSMNGQSKIKILYDGQTLSNYFTKDRQRGGIFFVSVGILKELLKQPELEVKIYAGTDYNEYSLIERFISSQDGFEKTSIFHGNVKYFDIFLSPHFSIKKEIKRTGIPCYTIIHDLIPMLCLGHGNDHVFYDIISNMTKEDYIFAISNSTKNDIIRLLPQVDRSKITTTLLAADEKFHPFTHFERYKQIASKYNIPENKRYLYSLCALASNKNLIFEIKNFVKFIQKNNIDDLVFVVTGSSDRHSFKAMFDAEIENFREYKTKIIETGYIEDDERAPLYSNAECSVFVSHYEGFGLPPLEAMQCGCPVIVSNTSSMPEVVGDAGILIDPVNDEDLIAAYEKVYFNEDLRKQMSQKGIERAKNFSWTKCVGTMVNEFKKHDFMQKKSSYFISIPKQENFANFKNFIEKSRKFLFHKSKCLMKTKIVVLGLEIFKIRKQISAKNIKFICPPDEEIFYIFGLPIFRKNLKKPRV